jgi:hypothetical protein
MRIRLPLTALAIGAFAAGCGDQSRELPTQPPGANPVVTTTSLTCDAASQARVREIIQQLYPDDAKTRNGLLKKFDDGLALIARGKTTEGLQKFNDIVKKVSADFADGKLASVSPSTAEVVDELFERLFSCAGFGDALVGVVTDPTQSYTFISTEGDFAVQTEAGMFSRPVVIVGQKQPDTFQVQDIYTEYAIKVEITANPPEMVVEGKKGIVKVCQYEGTFDNDPNRWFMRVVRRHDTPSGPVVTVLPFTTDGPFLLCPEAPPPVIGGASFFSRTLAAAGRALRGAGTFAERAFSPRELYATTAMVDGGVGGHVSDFLSFYAGATVPDLGVQSITVKPSATPTASDAISFDIVVMNTGFEAAPPSTLHFQATASSSVVSIAVPAVPAADGEGPGVATVASGPYTLAAGGYTATATADALNAVVELNETLPVPTSNNSATQGYTVAAPGTELVVFNDLNPFDETGMASADNVQLVRNLVGFSRPGGRAAASNVWFDTGRNSTICNQPADCPSNMTTMRSTIASAPGGPYTIVDVQSSPTSSSLLTIPADVKVLVLWMPLQAFTASEVSALRTFAGQGGRIVFVGEYESFYDSDVALNPLLTALNSGVQNQGGQVDNATPAYVNLPPSSLRADQITTGLTGLLIAASSTLSIGPNDRALYYSSDGASLLSAVAMIDGAPPILLTAQAAAVSARQRRASLSRGSSGTALTGNLRSSGLPQ